MKNNALSITAFVVVLFAIIATLTTIAFAKGIEKVEWMDRESIARACFGLAILGSVLGWCAFGRPLGKVAAILGTVVVAGFFLLLLQDSPANITPPNTAPTPPSRDLPVAK